MFHSEIYRGSSGDWKLIIRSDDDKHIGYYSEEIGLELISDNGTINNYEPKITVSIQRIGKLSAMPRLLFLGSVGNSETIEGEFALTTNGRSLTGDEVGALKLINLDEGAIMVQENSKIRLKISGDKSKNSGPIKSEILVSSGLSDEILHIQYMYIRKEEGK